MCQYQASSLYSYGKNGREDFYMYGCCIVKHDTSEDSTKNSFLCQYQAELCILYRNWKYWRGIKFGGRRSRPAPPN